jgi:hypothetical protein
MSEQLTPPSAKKSPYEALKYPQFVAYMFANSFITMALLIQEVLLGYEMYKVTHDPMALGHWLGGGTSVYLFGIIWRSFSRPL